MLQRDFKKKGTYSWKKKLTTTTLTEKNMREIPPTALFFTEIGVLLSKKLIDIDLVDSLFGGVLMRYWQRVKPLLESGRRELNEPRWGWGLEYLCNEMKKREQRQ